MVCSLFGLESSKIGLCFKIFSFIQTRKISRYHSVVILSLVLSGALTESFHIKPSCQRPQGGDFLGLQRPCKDLGEMKNIIPGFIEGRCCFMVSEGILSSITSWYGVISKTLVMEENLSLLYINLHP